MKTLATWDEYDAAVTEIGSVPTVGSFSHRISLHGCLNPGRISWPERDSKIVEVYGSTEKVEQSVRKALGSLEINAIETPRIPDPQVETRRYGAAIDIRDNGLVCGGISIGFMFNHTYERKQPLDRFPQTTVDLAGFFALNEYQERGKAFLRAIWDQIESFNFCCAKGEEFDSAFLLEVEGENPIRGGEHVLKHLMLTLPEKKVYIPC